MPSTKKPVRCSAVKAPICGKKERQQATNPSRSAVKPGIQAASDRLALKNIDANFPAPRERALAPAAGTPNSHPSGVPASNPIFKLFVLAPVSKGILVSFDCPAVLDLLDLVRQRCGVRIDNGVPFPSSLTVYGTSQDSVRAAHEDICSLVRSLGSPGQNQMFMVQPSDDQHRSIALTKGVNNPGWARFSFKEDPRGVTAETPDSWSLLQLRATVFRSRFAELANTLHDAPCNLHMQVQFGKLLLFTQDDRYPVSTGYAAAQLNSVLAKKSVEDSVVFDRRIGGRKAFDAFQQQIFRARSSFYPCSSVTEELADIQPQKLLVVITESFRCELEIGPPGSAPDGRSAKLSHLRVFQMLGSEGRTGLTTACPNHHIDWKLETIPELKPEEVPLAIKAFLEGVSIVHSPNHGDFPVPVVRTGLINDHRVKQLYGKTAWSVGCKGTQYTLELGFYHKFPRSDTKENNPVSMGISISNGAWEEILKSPTSIGTPRDLGVSGDKLFRPDSEGDGVIGFLKLINKILALWDRTADSTSIVKHTPPLDTPSQCNLPVPILSQRINSTDLLSGRCVTPAPPSSECPAGVSDSQPGEDLIVFD